MLDAAPAPYDPRGPRSEQLRSVIVERGLFRPLDVLLVGATGAGKSSTLNAIFGDTVAKVGEGVDPETKSIAAYRVHDYLRIHDSAGLGDGAEADVQHAKAITQKLLNCCAPPQEGYRFIDLALVVLDGSSRDLGTAFHLLESVVLKAIAPERVVVAINQSDQAMKGRHWNHGQNRPDTELAKFLADKVDSVQRRIQESTGLHITPPVCYSASRNWNIDRLMGHIIQHVPHAKRSVEQ
ncbi:GTP-binding protein HSR1 [Pseudoduganella sp. FT55W]|uniref:GTP-binding protein HSR1 n=1 Tax=Duganella rivi TaxID=2666083 RepID=A0A7X4K9Q3_9BURK|nr:GTPase [Duganella rivi]MYM65320.1 GTP-binding protein HSR1 [Duganella rivi]